MVDDRDALKARTGYNRAISPAFLSDLKGGILKPFWELIKKDDTLVLSLRGDYVNIYYRGGSLFKIKSSGSTYTVSSDPNYGGDFGSSVDVKSVGATSLVEQVPQRKRAMDRHFAGRGKAEREFQQLVARENNRSAISAETDYFVVDIESAGIVSGARFDMLAVRWQDNNRAKSGAMIPALVEMKYGSGALDGKAGLEQHLDHARTLLNDGRSWSRVVSQLQRQVDQLDDLELLRFNHRSKNPKLTVRDAKPEFIFLLANYDPAGRKLKEFLRKIDRSKLQDDRFDLRFFVSCFSGYGMRTELMLELEEFENLVNHVYERTRRRAVATA